MSLGEEIWHQHIQRSTYPFENIKIKKVWDQEEVKHNNKINVSEFNTLYVHCVKEVRKIHIHCYLNCPLTRVAFDSLSRIEICVHRYSSVTPVFDGFLNVVHPVHGTERKEGNDKSSDSVSHAATGTA